MIPARLIRTVPKAPNVEVEQFWNTARVLHPTWDLVTFRDPIDPVAFPITSPHWDRCTSGAQFAGLIRLEALHHLGGCYIDGDVELHQALDPLRTCSAFAAWEDERVVPDAVLGAEAGHPAIAACLDLALTRLYSESTDWHDGAGAWSTGPGVTTTILPGRTDVLLLPPQSFYPYPYTERHRRHEDHRAPFTFGAHHWAGSWLGGIV